MFAKYPFQQICKELTASPRYRCTNTRPDQYTKVRSWFRNV